MTIKKDSVLRNLPAFNKRTILILDSVRFTYDIISYSFKKLEECLLETSKQNGNKKVPESFMYAWNIIDHSQRLTKIIQNLNSQTDHAVVKRIAEDIRLPRNTYQHMDERIDQCLISKEIPFFGKLKWVYSPVESNFHRDFMAISGAYFSSSNKFVVGEYSETHEISKIILETSDKHDSINVDISSLYEQIKNYINDLEMKLENGITLQGLSKVDRKSFTDIIICFKGPEN